MKTDRELENWQSLWQADEQIPRDLRERAMRQVRRMRIMLAGDIAVTVVMGGGAVVWALNSDHLAVRLLAVWIWTTIAAAWIFRYFNGHFNNWTGAAPSTDAFFETWVKRCRETRRNLQFGFGLGIIQLVVSSAWVFRELHRDHGISLLTFVTMARLDVAWLCAGLLFAWAVRFYKKVSADLTYAERLRDEWVTGAPIPVLSPDVRPRVRKRRLLESIIAFSDSLDWQLRRKKKRAWKL
jgi:hypothetical protein